MSVYRHLQLLESDWTDIHDILFGRYAAGHFSIYYTLASYIK